MCKLVHCGMYYNHITIVNDDSRVIRMTLQVVASPTIVSLTTLEVSFMLLENILQTSLMAVAHECQSIFKVHATGHCHKLSL
jgi:predicted transporter